MSDREDMVALATVLRSRGRNNSLHDIERAAALLERFSARTGPDVEGFEAVLSFLDELADNASSGKRKALNPITIGGSAKLYAEGLRSAIAALPAPATAAAGWRTMDSAPKDGTEVWAFNGEQARMFWSQEFSLWVWDDELLNDVDPNPEQPTHWMPLPPAPTITRKSVSEERS